jgi:hypothetical protein
MSKTATIKNWAAWLREDDLCRATERHSTGANFMIRPILTVRSTPSLKRTHRRQSQWRWLKRKYSAYPPERRLPAGTFFFFRLERAKKEPAGSRRSGGEVSDKTLKLASMGFQPAFFSISREPEREKSRLEAGAPAERLVINTLS